MGFALRLLLGVFLVACSSRSDPPPLPPDSAPVVTTPHASVAPPATAPAPNEPPAANPSIKTEVRPLVRRVAPGDPVRLALHFTPAATPIPHDGGYVESVPVLDFMRSLAVAITSPDGRQQRFTADVRATRPTLHGGFDLYRTATLVLTLKPAGLGEASGVEGRWNGAGPDFLREGRWRIELRGAVGRSKQQPVGFVSEPVEIEVVRSADVASLANVEREARAELERRMPGVKVVEHYGATESGFVPDVVVDDPSGNLTVRYGNATPFRWGFALFSVTLTPAGRVLRFEGHDLKTCIARGTPIDAERGTVAVQDLRLGERVWGYDLIEQRRVLTAVRALQVHVAGQTVLIGGELRVSPDHPVYADGVWKPAGELVAGAVLVTTRGAPTLLQEAPRAVGGAIDVFDVTVEAPHTFFAGGMLVHNKDRGYSAKLDDPWLFLWAPP